MRVAAYRAIARLQKGESVHPLLRLHLLAFPPACWQCARLLPRVPWRAEAAPGYPYLCPDCHAALPWLADPVAGTVPGVERLWAACRYGPPVDGWIQRLKYLRRDGVLRLLATLLDESPAGRQAWGAADAVVPVPLHARRLRQRGFNQSLLLAHAWRRSGGAPASGPALAARLLVRHRYTTPQVRMSAAERHRNVADAFSLHPRLGPGEHPQPLQGRRLLLLDDVATTGSTLAACAQVLRAAGAERVDALVVARA